MQVMDYMDIDEIEEVPDTPERYTTTHNNDNNSTGKPSDGSSSCRVIDKDRFNKNLRNEPREKGKSVNINGSRRLFVRPDNCNNSPSFMFGNSSSAYHDKGKTMYNSRAQKFSSEGSGFVDLTEKNGRDRVFGLNTKSDGEKGVVIGSENKVGNILSSLDNTGTPPRANRHKRLVRNGCISPHNIAKSKQVAEKSVADVGNMSSNGPSNTFDIKDLIAETKDSHSNRLKGKSVSHSPFHQEPDARSRHVSHRSSENFKESEGWITTHNNIKKADSEENISRGKATSSNNIYNDFEDFQRGSGPPDTMSMRAHNLGQFKERAQLTKRQRDNVVILNNNREFDVPNPNIASSSVSIEPPTSSRLTRVKNRRGVGTSGPVISVDELTNEDVVNHGSSNQSGYNEDSVVRTLQLEADEMLARELQEQLYNEEMGSAFGINEMDSHATYGGGRSASRPAFRPASRISSSSSNLYQQSRTSSSRNPSVNRGPQAQTPNSSRLARFRGRFPGRPRSLSSANSSRNSIFPPNMNVDMRMEILEALEAFNDMELPNDLLAFNDMGFPNELLQMGREFNENDYEMLLALDENNHRHGGATRAQINNLPQSTVQAENVQECVICLETPTIGETIRHLPCFHRFHKDCIDEWLKRKTSCPVCKSSVT